MIKFLIGFSITLIYSFFIYAIRQKNIAPFIHLISLMIICSGCYYLGDMVIYRYMGNL